MYLKYECSSFSYWNKTDLAHQLLQKLKGIKLLGAC
jgi:hypothetical protein